MRAWEGCTQLNGILGGLIFGEVYRTLAAPDGYGKSALVLIILRMTN